MSEAERSEEDISPEQVVDEIQANLNKGEARLNEYVGANLPVVSFAFDELDGSTNHPLNFQYATIDAIDITRSEVRQGIDISHATIGELRAEDAVVHGDFEAHKAEFTSEINAEEAIFRRNAYFDGTTFQASVKMNEAVFDDESSFSDATFEEAATFKGATFSGKSHEIGNNSDFSNATFRQSAEFNHATFEYVTFKDCQFENDVTFDQSTFRGDALFGDVVFEGEAVFTEAVFEKDSGFENVTFEMQVTFEGAKFLGGSRAIEDDVSFFDAEFREEATFSHAEFRAASFEEAEFNGEALFDNAHFLSEGTFNDVDFWQRATFQNSEFRRDAQYKNATFHDEADFDEAEYHGDVTFEDSTYKESAVFRGAEFLGEARHLQDNAIFDNVSFRGRADFSNSVFRTASFVKTKFSGVCEFTGSVFKESVHFHLIPNGSKTYANMTEAQINGGSIVQDSSASVLYDMTEATIGDVNLSSEAHGKRYELLDYFRFCRTEFDGFEFSNHYDYFERNNWNIHSFADSDINVDYSVPMTKANIEQTYNDASGNASDNSERKAARQFSVKRHRFSRYKNTEMALDNTEPLGLGSRLQKLVGAGLNYFLDITCGYRTKFVRIAVITFIVIPFSFAFLYTLGGPFETTAGSIQQGGSMISTFLKNLHFSYITFTTVGYGNNGPVGGMAATLTAVQGSLNVMFGVLFTATFLGRFLDF